MFGTSSGLPKISAMDKAVNMEGNALQHPFIGLVSKPNVLKFDFALDLVQLNGVFFVDHLRLHIQNREDLFSAGKALLQHIKLLCQGLNGVKETGNIAVEGNHQCTVDDLT